MVAIQPILQSQMNSTPLPDFAKPPVTEVVLSLQFEPLPAFRSLQIGRLWAEALHDRFPTTEEHAPLEPTFERFGVVGRASLMARLQFFDVPPVARYWFSNEKGTDLVQLQQDRFIRNWRKMGDGDTYPRYEYVREMFQRDVVVFLDFLKRNNLGAVKPNQCEVTYINQVDAGGAWKDHGDVAKVISPWSGQNSDRFLPQPEDVSLNSRYVIPDEQGEPVGRLNVAVQPGYRKADEAPVFLLNLTARGRPLGSGVDGVLRFFDLGREWVVRGFASVTTKTMHQHWERRDGR